MCAGTDVFASALLDVPGPTQITITVTEHGVFKATWTEPGRTLIACNISVRAALEQLAADMEREGVA